MVPLQMGSLCLLACTFFLLLCIQAGDAITCYDCNSHNDSRCAQDVPPKQFEIECSEQIKGQVSTMCRKIVQSIEFEVNGLKPDTRIIRSCGWEKSTYDDRCYQRSGFGGRQEVCSCMTDLCNAAGRYETPLLALTVATALQFMAARYLF